MEDAVEFFVAELFRPIERGQVLRDEIAGVAREILEIAGAKIVDHRQARLGILRLQFQDEVGADETGAAGDEKVKGGSRDGHVEGAPKVAGAWA